MCHAICVELRGHLALIGPGVSAQVVKLGSKHLYLLRPLSGQKAVFLV